MKNSLKKGLAALAVSGLLVGGIATVSAQQSLQGDAAVEQVQHRGGHGQRGNGFGQRGGGFQGGLFGGRMVEGSTITATFYDGNPAEGANVLSTQTLNVGVDSERTFAQNTRDAMQDAAFVTINTSAQSRTLELPAADAQTPQGRSGFRAAPIRGLNEGSTLEAIFYDGNPEEGASMTTTLTFTAGVDSELAFGNAFQEAAANAAYVTLNTSPQERTLDLSQVGERFENPDFPNRGKGERGPGKTDGRSGPRGNAVPSDFSNAG